MRKTTILAAGALLAGLTATALLAQPPRRGPGPGAGFGPGEGFGPDFDRLEMMLEHRSERLADLLELTAAQRTQLDELRTSRLEAARPTIEALRQNAEELHALVESASPDPTEVGTRVLAMHRMKEELKAARQAFEKDLEALLTSDQKIAWDALQRARESFREDRAFGPRGERRGPGRRGGGFGYGAPDDGR